MSPQAKSLGTRGLVVLARWPRRCRADRASTPGLLDHAGPARPEEAHRQQHQVGLELELAARDLLHGHAAVGALHPLDAHAFERRRPCRPCRRRAWSAPRSRARTPSSCDDEVRSFSGQSGQVSALFSCSGGCGMISSWVTEAAPWRFEVPMQSEPVSPPPITMTCLPLAVSVPLGRGARLVVAGDALVLLGEEIHREVDAGELAARHFEVARPFGAAGQHHRVVVLEQRLDRERRRRPRRRCGTRRPRPPSAACAGR